MLKIVQTKLKNDIQQILYILHHHHNHNNQISLQQFYQVVITMRVIIKGNKLVIWAEPKTNLKHEIDLNTINV